jgi:hypothetical protein
MNINKSDIRGAVWETIRKYPNSSLGVIVNHAAYLMAGAAPFDPAIVNMVDAEIVEMLSDLGSLPSEFMRDLLEEREKELFREDYRFRGVSST